MRGTEALGADHETVDRASSPSLLLVAWEYPGVNSRQGTALARRVGQLARGFARHGWRVDVIHRSLPHAVSRNDPNGDAIALHGVPDEKSGRGHRTTLGRRLATAWHSAVHGDRSGQWAKRAVAMLRRFDANPPDLVIGCFTPRGPLAVARAAAERWKVPWIADLQDPTLEGASKAVRPLVRHWMRRTLKSAHAVVQVSPEWAEADRAALGREVATIRHAVPGGSAIGTQSSPSVAGEFVALYAGSLIGDQQSPAALLAALGRLNQASNRRVVLRVAGTDAARRRFEASLDGSPPSWFEALGWLGEESLREAIAAAHCLVLIPSNEARRPVVPSKLYEYVACDRPVLVAGPDSGAIAALLAEWQHPDVINRTAESIQEALTRALEGDFSRLFQRTRCGVQPMDENQLVDRYLALAAQSHRA